MDPEYLFFFINFYRVGKKFFFYKKADFQKNKSVITYIGIYDEMFRKRAGALIQIQVGI